MSTKRKYSRAAWHDYNNGVYFVTVVTQHRINYLGEIADNEVIHSEIGAALSRSIENCGLHYKGVRVDSYVVMPNHFHAIISISPAVGSRHAAADMDSRNTQPLEHIDSLGCLHAPMHPDKQDNFTERHHHNARLSVAIGGIKSVISKYANECGLPFAWQSGFHDHIIRNQREYALIREYIETNPQRWTEDKFYNNIQ